MNVTPSLPDSESPDPSRPTRVAPTRVARPAATRRRLLEAGLALFAEKGPRDVTSHTIAAKAGYAAGTFYLHFKDKLALFRELAEEAAGELEARLDGVAQNRTDPAEITRAQAEALVGFAEDRRDLLRIVFHPGGEAGEIGPQILARL
ncbi:MAG TPA: TetR/AcrR family transcriptional regulator, partial [Deltaproteobacteria bacterium]|nr:TetR/AcrR family transcriptional regulator [Deltaproteobacteria bacterium]